MEGKQKKRRRSEKKVVEEVEGESNKPQPPNIFLYIQLAHIKSLPPTINKFEIHIEQGDSVIVKCQEHYNTDGIIYHEEFNERPTFTLIIQQDNIERMNQVSNNPLLIMLYMRVPIYQPKPEAEEEISELDENTEISTDDPPASTTGTEESQQLSEDEGEKFYLELLSVGYIDILKHFSKRRTMVKEALFLYPVPSVPNELRITTQTEWHLYTLLPLLKEVTMCNLVFISMESIYNVKDYYNMENEDLDLQLYFRSTVPNEKNEYHEIPLCSYCKLDSISIDRQRIYHVFESFRRKDFFLPYGLNGLNSTIEVELHKLFLNLMRTKGLEVDFQYIDTIFDEVFMANAFHRYVLTKEMSDVLVEAIACNQYTIIVEVWKRSEPQYKMLEGVLDPSVLLYPKVRTMRFGVELKYVMPKGKLLKKRNTVVSLHSARSTKNRRSSHVPRLPSFAIIKICLFAPLGEVHEHLKVFTESFVLQNRLQYCEALQKEPLVMTIQEIMADAYNRLDKWIQDTISYLLARKVRSIEEKKSQFCCSVQNLGNILLKVVGSDFNRRITTTSNLEFVNLCALVYNELQLRIHSFVEKHNEEGFSVSILDYKVSSDIVIDYMNSIKYLYAVGDDEFAVFLFSKFENEVKAPDVTVLYRLIGSMELQDYKEARKVLQDQAAGMYASNAYLSAWVTIYLDYIDNLKNENTAKDALEFLLRDVTEFSEKHSTKTDGWILLYCLYKQHNYLPGESYARWHYEDYFIAPNETLTMMPYSLGGIFLHYTPEYETEKGEIFAEVLRVFLRLGMWEFARIVFKEIETECREDVRYLMSQNLAVLSQDTSNNMPIRTFPYDNYQKPEEMRAYNAQTNGSVAYFRGNFEEAKKYYIENIELEQDKSERDYFLLSKLRLAYLAYKDGEYHTTIRALSQPMPCRLLTLVANYMIAKSYYKMNELEKALEYFAKCTNFNIHVPNVWGYLALINLRLGRTYNALECWKYAKEDPTNVICEEIYDELELIDIDDVDMYIDLPQGGCKCI